MYLFYPPDAARLSSELSPDDLASLHAKADRGISRRPWPLLFLYPGFTALLAFISPLAQEHAALTWSVVASAWALAVGRLLWELGSGREVIRSPRSRSVYASLVLLSALPWTVLVTLSIERYGFDLGSIVGLLISVSASGLAVVLFRPMAILAFAFPAAPLVPLVVATLSLPDLTGLAVGIAVVSYLPFMAGIAHYLHREYWRGAANTRLLELRARELSRARDLAEAGTRAKSEFLANMSHEIRTPMTAIVGLLDLLASTSLAQDQRSYVETIESSARSLLQLMDDILDLSKIEAGKLAVELVELDLAAIVTEVGDLFRAKATPKDLKLHTQLPAGLPVKLWGDPLRLRQVLSNLVGNAVKFTEVGEVRLEVERQETIGDRQFFRFVVRDTGIGIPPETQQHLFTAFAQADSSTARRFEGTGLGLAISRRIVELLDGEIGCESAPGRGSTFWFTLPFYRSKKAATADLSEIVDEIRSASASRELPPRPAGGYRVLVAEDNDVNRLVALQHIRALGFQADAVSGGYEALSRLAEAPYDLVFMDCQMPDLDGFETTRLLRRREPAAQRATVVALTAHAMKGDRERCLAAGMDDYMTKPFRQEDLARMLARWLPTTSSLPTSEPLTDPSERAVLDEARLDMLRKLGERTGADILGELAAIFERDCPIRVATLRRALGEGNAADLRLAAHSLKGSAGNLGATSLYESCATLENLAENGDLAACPPHVERVAAESTVAVEALVLAARESSFARVE